MDLCGVFLVLSPAQSISQHSHSASKCSTSPLLPDYILNTMQINWMLSSLHKDFALPGLWAPETVLLKVSSLGLSLFMSGWGLLGTEELVLATHKHTENQHRVRKSLPWLDLIEWDKLLERCPSPLPFISFFKTIILLWPCPLIQITWWGQAPKNIRNKVYRNEKLQKLCLIYIKISHLRTQAGLTKC